MPARYRSKILVLFYLAQPLTTVIGAPLAGWLIGHHGVFGLAGLAVHVPVRVDPRDPRRHHRLVLPRRQPAPGEVADPDEQEWLTSEIEGEAKTKTGHSSRGSLMAALRSGRVWVLAVIYFGFIYGLYALAFFLPTIIAGFQEQFGTKFDVFEKGLITAIPYVPAAIVLYLWSRDASKRGVKTWHIAVPAFVGAVSVPMALFMPGPAATIAVITVTACAIFAALPNFWTVPTKFLTGTAAAVGIALINTFGNIGGFAAGYVTGFLKDLSGSYVLPMIVVGGLMVLSGVLMVLLDRSGQIVETPEPQRSDRRRSYPRHERTGPMTRLFNDPAEFADEMLDGFVAAHADLVRRVPGGVVRTTAGTDGKVAVVVGGGSGHYPAFAGLVGPGMADGAALGNIFASPSARQMLSVARAADRGAGVLCRFGNYAGDVLHFGQAAEMLNSNGIRDGHTPGHR